MSKSNKKNVVIVAGMICVLAIASIAALMTDTKTVTNTFTTGNVTIELTEPTWTSTGEAKATNITPNKVIEKDPTIKNVGANDAYMFMKVEVPKQDSTQLFNYTLNSGWVKIKEDTAASDKNVYVYAYGTADAMTSVEKNVSTPALFSTVKVADVSTFANPNLAIQVDAYGIQASDLGKTSALDIWGLISTKHSVGI